MIITKPFKIGNQICSPGELFVTSAQIRFELCKEFQKIADKTKKENQITSVAKFMMLDDLIKKADKNANFKDLIIVRYGGMGDLIALSSMIDYFEDKNIHFVTKKELFPVFDWFVKKPKLYNVYRPLFKNFNFKKKYDGWARMQCEGIIEFGSSKNWFEVFFDAIDENEPNAEMMRPQLRTDRINKTVSNIQMSEHQKKSLLICNKSTSMIRTINAMDILRALPVKIIDEFDIYFYEDSLSETDLHLIRKLKGIHIIGKTTLELFMLDCYDADMVISVDSGALHFREGVNRPAIGLYNSFTTDSRTKYYQYTKSFNIKSECEIQPCFQHNIIGVTHCTKGTKEMFAAPCFDSKINLTLHSQLSKIFNENL